MKTTIAIGAALCGIAAAGPAVGQERPNVVIVLTDDQGYGDMGCTGNPYVMTPNIDALYGESVRLANFHADPTSSPTRAALMTGKYSSRTGVWHTLQGRSIMDDEEVTMSQVFAENGYRTGLFGKWHLGDSYPYHPSFRGFEETVIHGGGGVAQNPDYWRNDNFDDVYMHNRQWTRYEGYSTDIWFNEAMKFIRNHKDEPFFCCIPTNAPHFWYKVPDRYAAPYRQLGMSDERARFSGMITCIDENLGRLRSCLDSLGVSDNTIFIFMTDNGSGFMRNDGFYYNAGLRGGKASVYEGGHRVPCFIYYKNGNIAGGKDVPELTGHIDIFPTLISLCGLENAYDIDFDGMDISSLLKGEPGASGHENMVVHHQRIETPVKYKDYCVMEGDWRLVGKSSVKELYNIKEDPSQKHDLSEAYPEKVAQMVNVYDEWWSHVSERFDENSEIYMSSPYENPVWLTCHDWHSDEVLKTWNQDVIREKMHGNGFWTIRVVEPGMYSICLRTYPLQEDNSMNVDHAELSIGNQHWTKSCSPGASQVTFDVNLLPGLYKMQTWMYDISGIIYGAPYAYVKRNLSSPASVEAVRISELGGYWEFAQADTLDWIPATVPGTVHTDLLNAGKINDPFVRDNERHLQWIDRQDWVYRTTFDIDSIECAKSNLELYMTGLDTYADVYLNGHKILYADNMFRTWTVDIKPYAKSEGNVLEVYFHSPIKTDLPKYNARPYALYSTADDCAMGGLGDKKISMYARKVQSQYGWDWGARFVTSGIWRPVYVRSWNRIRLEDVFYRQISLDADSASLTAEVDLLATEVSSSEIIVSYGNKELARKTIKLKKGHNAISIPFSIDDPQLWWPNGMGKQHLYNLCLKVEKDGECIDRRNNKVGLRTIRLVQNPDKWGKSFEFEVNGEKMFAKGANLIPTDNFLPRTGWDDYCNLVQSAADANMNMLRVWGGGAYQDDRFYDLCDSLGILVWQDFMFACKMYPPEKDFIESVRAEAIDNVVRLRNHPSLAMWCGNNEMTQGWYNFGWSKNKKIDKKYRDEMWRGYKNIFFDMLPEVIEKYDPDRFYWPSSPSSSFTEPQNHKSGDVHYWQYRPGKLPVTIFRTEMGRFMSEYGFNSAPLLKTLDKYLDEKDKDFASPIYKLHAKSKFEPELSLHYVKEVFDGKDDFVSGVRLGHVHQAEALKYVITQHRINQPFCMGSLYWQLNDCWPGCSWSTIDYSGEWKPAHYAVKKAFEPDIIGTDIVGDTVRIYGVTERREPLKARLTGRLITFDGKELSRFDKDILLNANTSTMLVDSTCTSILAGNAPEEVLLVLELESSGKKIASDNVIFAYPGKLALKDDNMQVTITDDSGVAVMKIHSDTYVKYVFVNVPGTDVSVSDNCFDLLPGEEKTLYIKGNYDLDGISVTDYLDYRK